MPCNQHAVYPTLTFVLPGVPHPRSHDDRACHLLELARSQLAFPTAPSSYLFHVRRAQPQHSLNCGR